MVAVVVAIVAAIVGSVHVLEPNAPKITAISWKFLLTFHCRPKCVVTMTDILTLFVRENPNFENFEPITSK
jgi:hypothetical protein